METNNIISLFFLSFYVYFIINTIIFILYRMRLKKEQDFYELFYYNEIRNKKLLYFLFTIFMIINNQSHKDEIRLKCYTQKKEKMDSYRYNYVNDEYYNSEVNKINKLVRQLELKIKLKKLKNKPINE